MTAQPSSYTETLFRGLETLTRLNNRPPNAITCARCDSWWTGLIAAHCSACHRTFTSVRSFDIHRRGGKCFDPASIRTQKGEPALIPADRPWAAWSEPGTWTGPNA